MKMARGVVLLIVVCGLTFVVAGQISSPQSQITARIDNSRTVVLGGNVHPWAQARFDRGPAPVSLPMQRMMLVLKSTPNQTTQLQDLLKEQQDPVSVNYHKWLTPEEFGEQFGASETDIQKITGWLTSQGFTIDSVAKGRNLILFSGNAGQVQAAFHTAIHKYAVDKNQYWANANDPAIPEALAPVVAGIASLNNFPRKPASRFAGTFARNKAGKLVRKAAAKTGVRPQFTYAGACNGTDPTTGAPTNCYALTPYDFATIYNVLPLWNASTPINGSGQTIAIVSDSDINKADFTNFRSLFGLPAGTLNVIYTPGSSSTNPGVQPNGNESEADVDTQWAGAVAPGATIDLVVSADNPNSTLSSFGGDVSAVYVIDGNVSPMPSVLGYSYGECEFFLGNAGNALYGGAPVKDVTGEWAQAAAEGITVVVSTGDNGSTACDSPFNTPTSGVPCVAPNQNPTQYNDPAVCGLAVSGIASTPFNVAVGGTDFNDGTVSDANNFWNSSNSSSTQASVKGYIPEIVYNDSCVNVPLDALYDPSVTQDAQTNCNNYAAAPPPTATLGSLSELVLPFGGGGGVSDCTSSGTTLSTCSGGYAKPTWQTGNGVPNDGKRDIPDISVFAGDGTFQNFYLYCQQDTPGATGACSLAAGSSSSFPNIQGVGGTSVSAEAFAGMVALLNQAQGSAVGLPNQQLYALAGQSWANCQSSGTLNSGCIFYQVTSGSNAMPCGKGTPDCVVSSSAVPPPVGPGVVNEWRLPAVLFLGFGLSLISFWLFRRASRRWAVVSASVVFLAFLAIAGCGGGGSGDTIGIVEANGSLGYNATAGYNMATGLGSLNVYNLVTEWNVSATSDFVLSATPAAVTTSGGTGTTTITVVSIGSFGATTVDFSNSSACAGLPSGASCSFSQTAVPGGQTTVLTITAPTSPGTQPVPITVTGTTGSETRTTTVMLTVQ